MKHEPTRILCVDDEPNILSTLRRFFRKDPYQLFFAADGSEAIEILERESPVALVISDYRMPGLNGVDLLSLIHLRWRHTVGLLLSGFSDLPTVSLAIENRHIFGHLAKPWNRAELRQSVEEALALYELRVSGREGSLHLSGKTTHNRGNLWTVK